MFKVFTTFTGIGCPEIAFFNKNIPFTLVGSSEVDKNAIIAYDAIHNDYVPVEIPSKKDILKEIEEKNIAYNFSTGKSEIPKNEEELKKLYCAHKRNKNYGDIRRIDEKALPDFNLFSYSYPCKNISVAGERAGFDEGSGTQSSLLWECERIIKEKKPTFLLMENVKNLVGTAYIADFEGWIKVLDEMGYNSYWEVMNAKNFGVPQNRERVIMISILKEEDKGYSLPKGSPSTSCVLDIIEDNVPEDFTIPHRRCNEVKEEYSFAENDFEMSNFFIDTVKQETKLIQVGRVDHDKNPHATRRVYDASGLCPTLTSMNGGDREPKMILMDNGEVRVRKLTPLECWRAMGIPDACFELAKGAGLPKSKLYERAGRGIAVPMLEEVLERLYEIQFR